MEGAAEDSVVPALDALVAEMAQVVAEMRRILGVERAALDSYDSDGLNQASAEKVEILARLDDLDARRLRLLADAGLDVREGMQAVAAWPDLLEALALGRDLNQQNGEIVSERLRQVRKALSMLNQMAASQSAGGEVYSAKGLSQQRGGSSTLGKA